MDTFAVYQWLGPDSTLFSKGGLIATFAAKLFRMLRNKLLVVPALAVAVILNGCVTQTVQQSSSPTPIYGEPGNNGLQSGPMIGYEEMREVLIWVQTKGSNPVEIIYWAVDTPQTKYHTDIRYAAPPAFA